MQLDLLNAILAEKIQILLDALNEDRKEKYRLVGTHEGNEIILLICKNTKDIAFNLVDYNGDIPINCSANWRNLEHIKQDLKYVQR